MSHFHGSWKRFVCRCALACVSLLLVCYFASARVVVEARAGADEAGAASTLSDASPKWLVVRLRSFVPGASGRVVVEPTDAGGRVRLMAARLPVPDSVAPNARAYVVWATGGQVRRLGELRRDARGNAAFEFAHPGGFDSYSVVVTAEPDARAERPAGAPVFSTRAGEVSALYPTKTETRAEGNASESAGRARTVTPRVAPKMVASVPAPASPRASSVPDASEFHESIDAAVEDTSVARTLTLSGEDGARAASGEAKVAMRGGTAYVRVRFRGVPLPSRFGVRKYVMWAQPPAEAPLFLRALPARRLNRRTIYARRRHVEASEFSLAVTAEKRYPAARPRGRRVLTTRGAPAVR